MDIFTKDKRSKIMGAIRSRDNLGTEIKLLQILKAYGIKGWRRHQKLPGNPDFIFRRQRLAVFVDGCFWHGCPKHGHKPHTNQEYWHPKLERTKRRDKKTARTLRQAGWKVLRIWAHALADQKRIARRIDTALATGRIPPAKQPAPVERKLVPLTARIQEILPSLAPKVRRTAPTPLYATCEQPSIAAEQLPSFEHGSVPPLQNSFSTIDLFCGAGGITEGFRRAGFTCLYGNDIGHWAIETFRGNHPSALADNRPIEEVDVAALRRALNLRKGELDVIVGGPPCQGFSINAPDRFLEDPRNSLFKHYIRFLDEFYPKTLLIENVPGMFSLGGGSIYEQILHELASRGYQVSAKILFAAHYGVPQERWRTIILGSRVPPPPSHPLPTHYAVARANFKGGKTMTFRPTPLEALTLLPPVTLDQAIGDLPRLALGEGAEIVTYDRQPHSEYSQSMRNGCAVTFNHYASKLSPQNIERMKYIKPGGSWRDIPHDLLPAGMKKARKSDHTKRYGRLRCDGLAGTVLTKCDPHWGAVFLPDQDRALTVREAARIQSFPDSYKFLGPRVAQYEQVGNAVPVLMAEAIARELSASLVRYARESESQHVA